MSQMSILVQYNHFCFWKLHISAVIVNDIGHNYHFKRQISKSNTQNTLESRNFALKAFMRSYGSQHVDYMRSLNN